LKVAQDPGKLRVAHAEPVTGLVEIEQATGLEIRRVRRTIPSVLAFDGFTQNAGTRFRGPREVDAGGARVRRHHHGSEHGRTLRDRRQQEATGRSGYFRSAQVRYFLAFPGRGPWHVRPEAPVWALVRIDQSLRARIPKQGVASPFRPPFMAEGEAVVLYHPMLSADPLAR
jgi:hypothetical protein